MSIGETFSRLLLKRVIEDFYVAGGEEARDAVVDFLSHCGDSEDSHLRTAFERAMRRGWNVLEAALDEQGHNHSTADELSPHDALALRQSLQSVFRELAHGKGVPNPTTARVVAKALRKRCLDELREARSVGALEGSLDPEELLRSRDTLVRLAVDPRKQAARRQTEAQLLRYLEHRGCVGLMRLLTGSAGLPLLLMATRVFFCQELERLLYRCLQDNPEQTPNACMLVLEILHELTAPCFTGLRSPRAAASAKPVHWSRLAPIRAASQAARRSARRKAPRQETNKREGARLTENASRAPWALSAVMTIAVVLLIVLPAWMLVDNARSRREDKDRLAAQRQLLHDERRRMDEERQRLLDEQWRLVREEERQREELRKHLREEEDRRRMEQEEERQREADRAVERRKEEKRQLAEERRARLREEERRREQAQIALVDGMMQSAFGKDRQALERLDQAIRLDPSLDKAYLERAQVRRRLRDLPGALDDFHKVLLHDLNDAACWFACGELHHERKEDQLAIEAFTAVIRLQPRRVEAYRLRGLCYGRIGEERKAFADHTKAIDLAPNEPWSYWHRGELLRKRGESEHAFADYTSAIDRNREDARALAPAYRERGRLHLRWGSNEQAIADFSHAVDRDAADMESLRWRAEAYLRIGEWNDALLDAERLIRNQSAAHTAYKLRGKAFMGLGDYQRAHDDFSQALRGGRDAEAYYLRACASEHLGDYQEAIFDCNDATSMNPQLAEAFYLRGRLNLRAGYRLSGLADCRTAHNLDPQFPLP
jgi:tetratricopeptide (TPR) repeat protein